MEARKSSRETFATDAVEKLIKQIEAGTAPWQKPWNGLDGMQLPYNVTTGNRYQGINTVILMSQGYDDPRWATYHQAASIDARVRSGERSTACQKWIFEEIRTRRDESGRVMLDKVGEPVKEVARLTRPKLAVFHVFNAEQIDGLAPLSIKREPVTWDPIERAETILKNSGASIRHALTGGAFYSPLEDAIQLPAKERFPSAANYYAVALHELGHWTGHKSRLDRDLLHPFGSQGYAIEELKAEIASMLLGEELRIGHDPANHASYAQSWIQALRNDPTELFRAAADAEKIRTFVLKFEQQLEHKQDPQSEQQEVLKVSASSAAADPKGAPPMESSKTFDATTTERVYLAVPYRDRELAKQAGARWDLQVKCWYIGPKPQLDKLEQWFIKPGDAPQKANQTPQEEFAATLNALGFVATPGDMVMDGHRQRLPVQGDKKGERSGFYVGHLDGRPAGYAKNNRTQEEVRWKSLGYSLSDEDRAKLQADAAMKLAARAAEEQKVLERTAQRLEKQFADLPAVRMATPYDASKGLKLHAGVRANAQTQTLHIPAFDVNGKHWSTQYVQPDGRKRFAKDSRKEGCFHVVGGFTELAKAPVLVIGEGYSTMATARQAVGFATVAAFDSGNVPAVAVALHQRFPDKPVVILGDDDRHVMQQYGRNPGRTKAEEAAALSNGKAIFPIFAPKEQEANPAAFTDFNDLATKSVLGEGSAKAQITSVVSREIQLADDRARQNVQRQSNAIRGFAQGNKSGADDAAPVQARKGVRLI